MNKFLLLTSLSLVAATGVLADTFNVSSVNGGAATGSTRLNLDLLSLGNGTQWAEANVKISFTGTGQVVQGASSGYYAAPFISGSNGAGFGGQPAGADTTRYLSSGIGSVVFDFTSNQTYFGLLWGSVDDYNSLSFYKGGLLVGSYTGSQIWAAANGDQGTQGTFYVNFDDVSGSFNRVVASSTQYAFEIDNIAYNSRSVPDAGSSAALVGLGLVGLMSLRRKL
jgi:hypothetical protein